MNLTNTLPEKIRQKRLQKGLSQENMADSLGISTTAYGDLERGRTEITLPRMERIAEVLDSSLGEFLETTPKVNSEEDWLRAENLRLQAENLQLKAVVDQMKRKFQEIIGNELLLRVQGSRERIGF